MKIKLKVEDNTNFDRLLTEIKPLIKEIGVDLLNDMQYVTRGAAPFDTGQLTRNISAKSTYSGDSFKGEIGVSSYNSGFDYGVLRHDFPFKLGEGSLKKPPVTSPITGETFVVGYAFASEPLMGNAKGYIDYIEEQLRNLLQEYSS